MYLHLGQNIVVPEDSVVGIFDLDNSSWSPITRKYLSDAEKNGNLVSISEDIPKSFILCTEISGEISGENSYNATGKIYLSQVSSQTLLKRSELTQFIQEGKTVNVG